MPLILTSAPSAPVVRPSAAPPATAADLSPAQWRLVSALYSAFVLAGEEQRWAEWHAGEADRLRELLDALPDHPDAPKARAREEEHWLQSKTHKRHAGERVEECCRVWVKMDRPSRAYAAGVWGIDADAPRNAFRAWVERQLSSGGAWNRGALECPF